MCYKIEKQSKNAKILEEKMNEKNIPNFMRKFFTLKAESSNTSNMYLIVIYDFLLWLIDENVINSKNVSEIEVSDLSEVMAEDITAYLRMKEKNGMSPTTLGMRRNVLSSFWKYLSRIKGSEISEKFFKDVTYKGISTSSNLIKKLPTEQQLKDMEEKIKWKKDERVRNRNLTIFYLLKGSGIRESELAGLDLSDLYLNEDMPYIKILGKGRYREEEKRVVYLTNKATTSLKEWLEYRNTFDNITEHSAVFINKNGTRTTEDNIKNIFRNYGNGITPHMMRHYYASIIANKGNITFAQQQLGHTSISTTIGKYANGSIGMKEVLGNM